MKLLGRARGWDILSRSREGKGSDMARRPGSLLPSLPLQCDRLAADCAQELKRHGVSYVSLWPGLVQTEVMKDQMLKGDTNDPLFKQVGEGREGRQKYPVSCDG